MYELQLFNPPTGRYVRNVTGEKTDDLRDLGRLIASGDGFRIVKTDRQKPLPLKPRIPYGCSGKPRRYRPDTMIEPAGVAELVSRAVAWYVKREKNGERNIPVYVWESSQFGAMLSQQLALGARPDVFRKVELDPDIAFGEIHDEHALSIAA